VDLIPFKTCSFDCVYCECGSTTNLTGVRDEYIDTAEVIKELDDFLKKTSGLDYITFSGSGEPTLHSKIGEIAGYIKDNWPQYSVALLTNGSLLYDKSLRNELMLIDLVKISVDSVTQQGFSKINRPVNGIDILQFKLGIREFCSESNREIYMEMFIVPGVNDTEDEVQEITDFLKGLSIEKLQLNTLDRPSAESWVRKTDPERVKEIAKYMSANLDFEIEIIGDVSRKLYKTSYNQNIESMILSTISRRPMTDKDIASVTGIHINSINKYLSELLRDKRIVSKNMERGVFFEKV